MTTPGIFALGAQYRFAPPVALVDGRGLRHLSRSMATTSVRRTCPWTARSASAQGFKYDWNDDVTVGLAYEYLDAGDAGIDQKGGPLQGDLKGDYGTTQFTSWPST